MHPGVNRFLKPFRGRICVLCVLAVLSALLQVTNAIWMRDVVDAAISAPDELLRAGIRLVLNLISLVLLYALSNWLGGSASDKCTAHLRRAILKNAAFSEAEKLYDYHSGSLLSRGMEDVRTLCDGSIHALPGMVGQATRLAASFAAVMLLYPSVAVYVALAALAAAFAVAAMRPVLKKNHARVRKADERLMACMQEDLQQLELVKSLGAEEQMLGRLDASLDASLEAKRRRRFWTVGSNTVLSGASQIATAVMLLWGAGRVAAEAMTYGSLTAMLQLLSLLRGPVLGLSGLWTRFAAVEVAAERLQQLLAETPDAQSCLPIDRVEAVVFEHVTFAYPGEEEPVLRDFSAVFPLEQWLCLSGVSGRGKSTLFKLMLGLYRPEQGGVYLQTAGRRVPCGAATRQLFAYVPQDYALFSGSIMDNLLLAAPEADESMRRKALRLACADFVFELPDGERTMLRENNDGLSKGQLQRIAVARAILMDRPVLLMDECSSALDAETERAMLRNLHSQNVKAILVTHRPEALDGLPGVRHISMEQI